MWIRNELLKLLEHAEGGRGRRGVEMMLMQMVPVA